MVVAYTAPAVVVWGALGAALGSLQAPRESLLWGAALYCLVFGLSEATGLASLRAPTLTWQVPATWVGSPSETRRVVAWGVLLGPGLVTRNPYAGMWVVPLCIALARAPMLGLVTGLLVGVAHGTLRAGGVIYNVTRLDANVHRALFAYFSWRLIDGFALVALGTFLLAGLV
jgi:hypothetical protein